MITVEYEQLDETAKVIIKLAEYGNTVYLVDDEQKLQAVVLPISEYNRLQTLAIHT